MPKQSLYGAAAFKKLQDGVNNIADAVVSTLGPSGSNVIVEQNGQRPVVSKDGVFVANAFDCEDPVERIGATLVREAAQRTNRGVGDGTTTSVLLAREIINRCATLSADADVHAVRKEMNEYVAKVCSYIDDHKVAVDSLEVLTQVATISANNDTDLGQLVAGVVWQAGKDGVVTIEESSGTEIETEVVDGFQIAKGFASPYMMTAPERGEATFNDAPVLVTDKRLSGISDVLPVMEKIAQAGGKQLIIIAEEVEGDALAVIVANKMRVGFSTLAVKAPGYGDQRKEMLKDLAIALGATFVSDESAMKLSAVEMTDLGTARKVTATKDKTTFIGGGGDKDKIAGRVAEVEKCIDEALGDYDREKYRERLARLMGGVALIRVGAQSESEMKEKKFLIEDAVNAAKVALADGVVAGGGMTLYRAASELPPSFITDCLFAPLLRILKNAGADPGDVPAQGGYDAKARVWVEDMVVAGIIDPAIAAKETLRNAVSVASLFLTTDCVLYDKPEPKKK